MPDAAPLLVVAAALVDADGSILMQRRPPGTTMAGLWEFPGGKIEPGEAPEAALVRELAEELDIAVAVDDPVPAAFASVPHGDRQLILLLYFGSTWRGTPRPVEASALRWVHPAALPDLPMPPADVPLAAMIGRLR